MSNFKFGTTRMAGAFFVEYTGKKVSIFQDILSYCVTDEKGTKWYGDKATNDLVGLFPTFGALFEHFGKAADEHKYTINVAGKDCMTMRVPATKEDGTPFELLFTLLPREK